MLEVLKRCFSVNLNEYENININLEINKVVILAFFVFAVCVVFLNVYRGNIRLVTSQLFRHGATDEQSAKTLTELGIENSKIVKILLSGDNLLTKVVGRVGEKRYTSEEYKTLSKEEKEDRIDFSSAAFYVREDKAQIARGMSEKYVTSPLRTAVICVLIAIVCVCVVACMPGILNIVNNLIEKVKSK